MSRALRLSEKWFRRGLWLVAFLFAGFLIGLGSAIVNDMPLVERPLLLDDFLADKPAAIALRLEVKGLGQDEDQALEALAQARLQYEKVRNANQAERETLENWLATRTAINSSEYDPELLARTRDLDFLKQAERQAQRKYEAQQQALLDTRQALSAASGQLNKMEHEAREMLLTELDHVQMRIFLYRLALTLPLLLIAAWLFARKRQSNWWPFVWGFMVFALFAFFVELVPYLPSYGGYVRSLVGIIITLIAGRYAILALRRYLEAQKQAESQPEQQRRKNLDYEKAQSRLAKGVCPGCERSVDLRDGSLAFCPHCGMGLFDTCSQCSSRKSAFARFCHACGVVAGHSCGIAATKINDA